MKKRWIGILLAVLLVFSAGSIAMAGIDLEGELNYELGDIVIDGYTQVAVNGVKEPFDLNLTWRRDWIPVLGDSLLLDAGISLGYGRLGYVRELLESDVGIASLTLIKDSLVIKYARTLDGLDLGTIIVNLALAPFTFKYTKLFGDGTQGTVFVRFEKSL